MIDGLNSKKYLHSTKKRFDPISLVLSITGLAVVVGAIGNVQALNSYIDVRSLIIVPLGTMASLLFQYDFGACARTLLQVLKSFSGTPEKKVLAVANQLDQAILNGANLTELRDGTELTGELLNDIVFMHQQGLLFDEIDAFVTSKIQDEFFNRKVAVTILNRAALIAPSFGLFGTVMGLMNVLTSLSDPSNIGPSMSLALMTTAYGAGLGSLMFTPMAGRLTHHNEVFLEIHKQILNKVGILLNREERTFDFDENERIEAA